jgi:hypothetical protein
LTDCCKTALEKTRLFGHFQQKLAEFTPDSSNSPLKKRPVRAPGLQNALNSRQIM